MLGVANVSKEGHMQHGHTTAVSYKTRTQQYDTSIKLVTIKRQQVEAANKSQAEFWWATGVLCNGRWCYKVGVFRDTAT